MQSYAVHPTSTRRNRLRDRDCISWTVVLGMTDTRMHTMSKSHGAKAEVRSRCNLKTTLSHLACVVGWNAQYGSTLSKPANIVASLCDPCTCRSSCMSIPAKLSDPLSPDNLVGPLELLCNIYTIGRSILARLDTKLRRMTIMSVA